jgi:selenide,water dikinase
MRLLLVGGGHSHLAVLKSFGDAPPAGVRLALLSPGRHIFYSGMIPGLVAGHYRPEDCRIDLARLAARAGASFLEDSAVGIDPPRRNVTTARGERLPYDLLSLDVGSEGAAAPGTGPALSVRPIELFLGNWERLSESAKRGEVGRIAVVGGGAAGIELLLAMRHALSPAAVRFALFSDSPVLAGHGESARRIISRILAERGIDVHAGVKVLAAVAGGLEVEGGERFEAQATVWAVGARAPAWIAACGIGTDPLGFVDVSDALQSRTHPEIFAAGDVASLAGNTGPKSGVIAVRQGPALTRNLRLAISGKSPRPFRAPGRTLALISCGDRYAAASWGSLALRGAWIWRWKDRIDRRFVARYRFGT